MRTFFSGGFILEGFNYDTDGNLENDEVWAYEWDAENRLRRMSRTGESLDFKYDYTGRRVEKVHTLGAAVTTTRFVYEGFNLIAEMDGSAGVLRSFVWGLDESGTTQGAGGVGGLLMIVDGASKYLTAYDGSGNLTALIDEADGSVAAAYEYGPFGEPLRASGDYADANPFRFSTKYTDSETGLVYFGLRYYNATSGRFINRDPIGEAGGLNLYGFVGNDPINRVDFLGLCSADDFFKDCGEPDSEGFISIELSSGVSNRVVPDAIGGLKRFIEHLLLGTVEESILDNLENFESLDSATRQETINLINDSVGLDGRVLSGRLILDTYNAYIAAINDDDVPVIPIDNESDVFPPDFNDLTVEDIISIKIKILSRQQQEIIADLKELGSIIVIGEATSIFVDSVREGVTIGVPVGKGTLIIRKVLQAGKDRIVPYIAINGQILNAETVEASAQGVVGLQQIIASEGVFGELVFFGSKTVIISGVSSASEAVSSALGGGRGAINEALRVEAQLEKSLFETTINLSELQNSQNSVNGN